MQILIQWGWVGPQSPVVLTSFQVIPMLLVLGLHFEGKILIESGVM